MPRNLRGDVVEWLLNTLSIPIQIFDFSGKISYANSSYCDLYGIDRTTLRGRYVWEFYPPDIREQRKQDTISYFKFLVEHKPAPTPFTEIVRTAKGELFQMTFRWNYVLDLEGSTKGILAFIESSSRVGDETYSPSADSFTFSSPRYLDQGYETERNAKMERQARLDMVEFVCHEIGNPLAALVTLVETSLPAGGGQVSKETVADVSSCVKLLQAVSDDLLHLSTMEHSFNQLQVRNTWTRGLVEQVFGIFAVAVPVHLFVIFDVDALVPERVVLDPVVVKQVLRILAHNAAKYTETGGISVRVHCQTECEDTCSLTFQVDDTGKGIPQSDLQLMFKPQKALMDPARARSSGSGLSLYLCQRLCLLMNTNIDVQPLETGTRFQFTVEAPKHQEGDDDLEPRHLVREAVQPPPPQLKNPKSGSEIAAVTGLTNQDLVPTSAQQPETGPNQSTAAEPTNHTDPLNSLNSINTEAAKENPGNGHTHRGARTRKRRHGSIGDSIGEGDSAEVRRHKRRAGNPEDSDVQEENSGKLPTNEHVSEEPEGARDPTKTLYHMHGPPPDENSAKRPKVLVVEDNTLVLKLLSRQLQNLGCMVDTAADGQQGLGRMQEGVYDLVLMDIMMPVMNGYQAVRALREWEMQQQRRERQFVVGVTANCDPKKAMEMGMDECLPKPLRQPELKRLLDMGNAVS